MEMKSGQYLVVSRHTIDDVPVRLFATVAAARDYCNDQSELAADESHACDVLGIDVSTPCAVAIYAFDANGKMASVEIFDRKEEVSA
jgi:hypothetical protein